MTERPSGVPEESADSEDAQEPRLRVGGALGRTVQAGLAGEAVSAGGVLAAIGGWRGVVESLLPGLLFLLVYVFTKDPYVSVIAPAAIALIAMAVRLIARQPVVSALSGALGVGVCIAATLWTGSGRDYFLPGFLINAGWIVALLISLLVRWPLLGLVMGSLRGDLTSWRGDRLLRNAATLTTVLWLALFVARLAVQVPLYLADRVEALGVARLVMGVPLFALVVLFTWLLLSRASLSSDVASDETVENTGENAPS